MVPGGAAGIQWAKTEVVDNASGGRATEEASVLWDSPAEQKQKLLDVLPHRCRRRETDRRIGRKPVTLTVLGSTAGNKHKESDRERERIKDRESVNRGRKK